MSEPKRSDIVLRLRTLGECQGESWLGTCRQAADEIERLRAVVEPLNNLRAEEGAVVTLYCDNPDSEGPGCRVGVYAAWGDKPYWSQQTFEGDNLADALWLAAIAKQAIDAVKEEQP